MTPRKIFSLPKLQSRIGPLRSRGKKIVFTNGTFDILHAGHISYLTKAKSYGDVLVVGVNSDRSVRTYKGPDRPVNPQQDRLRVVAALQCVDYVVMFNEPTPLSVILRLHPDVLVKGSDWKKGEISGAREVESWGGLVRRVPLVRGRSTTRLIEKIRKS